MSFRQIRKEVREKAESLPLGELLDMADRAWCEAEGSGDHGARAVYSAWKAAAAKRMADRASSMGTSEAATLLSNLKVGMDTNGDNAMPSWHVQVEALTGVLARRHPEAAKALNAWGQSSGDGDPITPVVAAARKASQED